MSRKESDNKAAIVAFSNAMLAKMNANNHKRSWHDASVDYLMHRLIDEVMELAEAVINIKVAVERGGDVGSDDLFEKAMAECADVANFPMMIWDKLRHRSMGGSRDSEYL